MIPATQRDFICSHCNGRILIPINLPPTTAQCPHCGLEVTSPPLLQALPIQPMTQPIPPAPEAVPIQKSVEVPRSSHLPPPRNPVREVASASEVEPSKPAVEAATHKAGAKAQKEKHTPAKKSILVPMLVLLFLILAAGAAFIYLSGQMHKTVRPIAPRAIDEKVKQASYIRIGWQRDAAETLGHFLKGTTVEEKLPYILNGEQLRSQIESFYGGGKIDDGDTPLEGFSVHELSEEDRKRGLFMMVYDQPKQFEMREFFRPLASLEVQHGLDEADLLLSSLARIDNFSMESLQVYALFKKVGDRLLLDWETFVQTKYRTFQTFTELAIPGSKAVFRVLIVEDVPIKGLGMAGMRTYRLADPANTGDASRINVVVDSEVGRAVSLVNWRGKNVPPSAKTATVELEWSDDPENPVLSISRFICWEFLGLGGQAAPTEKAEH